MTASGASHRPQPGVEGLAGVVLAAGASSRLGQPKALVEVEGVRLVDRAVASLRLGGCSTVLVVTGAVDLTDVDAEVVPNPTWSAGMGSTLRLALGRLEADPSLDAVVLTLVDTPSVSGEVVRRLATVWREGSDLVVATYGGSWRTPVVIGREHWAGVRAAATGDSGARTYLTARAAEVTAVECGDLASWWDVDTPADLDHRL